VESMFPLLPGGSGRPVAKRASVPVHQAGDMRLGSGKLRQECWENIGERTRTRTQEFAGRVIEWFASEGASSPDGRSYAVVFGEQGLAVAEPRINTEHRPVYAISAFLFDPASLRHVRVDHRPPPHTPTAPAAPAAGPAPDLGLRASARGLLGNLPPRAQELLQAPFVAGQRILRCDWAYEGFDHQLNMFMLYLAGPRDVTVATGTKVVPVGHTDATAHWSLTCYRVSVVRRIGK
jgi:hypothetical protein